MLAGWKYICFCFLFPLLLFVVSACDSGQEKVELTIGAAMSLKDALSEIGQQFEQQHLNCRVRFHFASSGTLATQIIHGAPLDVYASASQGHMDHVLESDMILEVDRHAFARNSLVLIKPRKSQRDLNSMQELPHVAKIAIGNPKTVPAGSYARDLLQNLSLWQQVKPRLVYAEHVRQVLDYVARGEVDAGLVYLTDARMRGADVAVVATAPQGSHSSIVYPVAVIDSTKHRALASSFVEFLISNSAQSTLGKYGFEPPKPVQVTR